jgi:putative salt-induced outer membrane protein YdiY
MAAIVPACAEMVAMLKTAGFFLFLSSFLCGALFGDQVTLKNGDVITGAIIKKDGDKLTIKSEFLGEVTMPWNAITSIKSDNPLFVDLPGGAEVNGKVSTQGDQVEIQSPQKTQAAPLTQIAVIRNADEQQKYEKLRNPSWLQLWTGYVDLGFSIARGNASTDTLNTAFNAARNTTTDQTTVFLNQIYAEALVDGVKGATANAVRGGISYNHNLNPRMFLNLFNTDETDRFQDLNYRLVAGVGVGYHAIKTDKLLFDLVGGGDYNHASFFDMTQNLAEVDGGDDLSYKLSKTSTVTQSFRIFDAPSDSQYRMNFNLGSATTIRKWLSWQLSASDQFLSDPPIGRKRNDLVLTTGIRASFSH